MMKKPVRFVNDRKLSLGQPNSCIKSKLLEPKTDKLAPKISHRMFIWCSFDVRAGEGKNWKLLQLLGSFCNYLIVVRKFSDVNEYWRMFHICFLRSFSLATSGLNKLVYKGTIHLVLAVDIMQEVYPVKMLFYFFD